MSYHDEKLKPATTASEAERRAEGRHPFIAAADVVELRTGTLFSTRTTDLGPGGCFLDTLVPFEAGAKVRIIIRDGETRFEATGIVVYSQSGLGMGIAFDNLRPEQRRALAFCLRGETSPPEQTAEPALLSAMPMFSPASDGDAIIRLVTLMVAKGMLSEAEATALFENR